MTSSDLIKLSDFHGVDFSSWQDNSCRKSAVYKYVNEHFETIINAGMAEKMHCEKFSGDWFGIVHHKIHVDIFTAAKHRRNRIVGNAFDVF